MRYICWLILVVGFLLPACRENGTGPANTPQPGKRNYVWTVDTLSYPGSFQTLMKCIWASSAKDVYVGGHNSLIGQGTMYHYDGSRWTPESLLVDKGGTITRGFDISAIYGFARNDVYAVGEYIYRNSTPPPNFLDSSLIIHFDGGTWREMQLPERGRQMISVWGASPTDVWFGGAYGTLYHYDGVSIRKVPFDSLTGFSCMAGSSPSNIYATCVRKIDFVPPDDSSFYFLYKYNGHAWKAIDSFLVTIYTPDWKFGLSLWESENANLYSATYGVYLLENGAWRQLFYNELTLLISGSSDQNIFAVGDRGRVFHWNGTDWKRWTEIEDQNKLLGGVWTNNVETFIVGIDGLVTFIIHGK